MADYAPVPGRIPGKSVNLGGRDFVLAPLNLDGIREFEPIQQRIGEGISDAAALFDLAADALILSLRRNYPDISKPDIVALLDMGNVWGAMETLAEVTGYRRAAAGES